MAHVALDESLVASLVAAIASAVAPEKIILFGSCARGDAGAHSDLDLFVQVQTGRDTHEATTRAYQAVRPLRARLDRGLDIVVKDRAFVERYGDLVGTVVRTAIEEGQVLYVR